MKKTIINFISLIFLSMIIITIPFSVFNYVKASAKVKVPISRRAEIFYEDEHDADDYYYEVAIRMDERYFNKLTKKMSNKGFVKYSINDPYFEDGFLIDCEKDWIPIENITEVYEYCTVESFNIIGSKRIHIYAYAVLSDDGYREIYFTRN